MADARTIIVRFASALPDLTLPIESASTISISGLKRLIRAELPEADKSNALRLIYSGRVLDDAASIAAALPSPSSTTVRSDPLARPSSPPSPGSASSSSKGKGRATQQPIYIHCAISSSALTPSELAAEAANATITPSSRPPSPSSSAYNSTNTHVPNTTQGPRGFARLSLPAEELSSLRAQHRALLAARHTPDTMPSEAELLELEERWLEDSSGPGGAGGGAAAAGALGADEDDHAAQLMDTLWGAVMGFFWPVGCVVWGLGESGLWSKRRRDAVVAGVFVNLGFAIMRVVSWADQG